MSTLPGIRANDWHLVQTKPNQEFYALAELENQHYRCFLPTLTRERIVRGKVYIAVEALFSRYLFVQNSLESKTLSAVRNTRGVSRLVSFGGRYATLPDECIEALRRTRNMPAQSRFPAGSRVEITAGPFMGLEGIYEMPNGEARATVMIELMNRPQKISLALETLRAAA